MFGVAQRALTGRKANTAKMEAITKNILFIAALQRRIVLDNKELLVFGKAQIWEADLESLVMNLFGRPS
jgi:hypothetical protein